MKSVLIHGAILKLLYDFDMLLPNRSLPGGGGRLTRALGTKAVQEHDDCHGKGYSIHHLSALENVGSQNLFSLPCFGVRKPCDRRPSQFIFSVFSDATEQFAQFLSIETKMI